LILKFSAFCFGFFVVLCELFCACAAAVRSPLESPVYVTNSKAVYLLPPSDMGFPIDAPQMIEGAYGGKKFSFEGWTVANDSIISISLFNSIGASIGSLFYSKDSLRFESSFIDVDKIHPQYIVADFQLCYYKKDALQKIFSSKGFFFSEDSSLGIIHRVVLSQKDTIVSVVRSRDSTVLKNYLRGYEYRIHYREEN